MRCIILVTYLLAGILIPAPASAQRCEWFQGRPYCDPGCTILRRWRDQEGAQWFTHACTPPIPGIGALARALETHPLLIASLGIGVAAGLLVLFFEKLFQACSRRRAEQAEQQTEPEATTADALADAARNLSREIDAFVETTARSAYRRGRDSLE